nr:hypothetical protein [Tanacetum cinerariifolium]
MKCNPDNFHGTERAVQLRRWFEKTEMTFGISKCTEDKKVKGFMSKETPNEAINVLIEDEESPSSELRGSILLYDIFWIIMANVIPPDHVDDLPNPALVIPEPVLVDEDEVPKEEEFEEEEEPQEEEDIDIDDEEDENDPKLRTQMSPRMRLFLLVSMRQVRRLCGRETVHALVIKKGKAKDEYYGLDVANQMGWTEMKKSMTTEFCPAKELRRMENELWNLKVEYNMVAYTQRFNELALMYPRMVKPESVKVDSYIQGLSDNIKGEVTSSKPTNLNEVVLGQCTIKCHKCGKIAHKARYCKEKNVATDANAQPVWTCYDYGKQGHTRNRCPKKVKQEEAGEVCG